MPVAVTAETASYVSSANISASLGVVGTLAKSAVLEGCRWAVRIGSWPAVASARRVDAYQGLDKVSPAGRLSNITGTLPHRFAAEGHGSFELQTSVHDPNIADLDQAGVQHISGCTVRSNGNMGLTTTSGSSGIFASVIVSKCSAASGLLAVAALGPAEPAGSLPHLPVCCGQTDAAGARLLQVDGSEFLVDCPPGSETCNLLVVLPGVNTGSSLSLSGGLLQLPWRTASGCLVQLAAGCAQAHEL